MRNKVGVFYYPEMVSSWATLKKAILLFDEIHFIDRPSFMFGAFAGSGQFGTVGCASPLRQYEASFRAEGVPLFVHSAQDGPVVGEFYERIKADIDDELFLRRFQEGIRTSKTFRDFQIAHGNYGQFGSHVDVAGKVLSVDLPAAISQYGTASALFEDPASHPFDLSTPLGCAKNLIAAALTCSAKMNLALDVLVGEGLIPLADAAPYGDLLGAKYARAVRLLNSTKNQIHLTDLGFGIFDGLLPSERLEAMSLKEVIDYRKASEKAREELLDHLSAIQAKQASIGIDGDYSEAIERIINAEVFPAVRMFKNRLKSIDESLFAGVAKGIVGYAGSSAGLTVFGDLSWEKLLMLAAGAGAYIANAAIDAVAAERAARRECSISYILSLDK